MRLTVENLGRIRHAQLDLAPLSVFVGENGTNKTWTAYALYALLDPFLRRTKIDAETSARLEHALAPELAALRSAASSEELVVTLDRTTLLRALDGHSPELKLRRSVLPRVVGNNALPENAVARLLLEPTHTINPWKRATLRFRGGTIRIGWEGTEPDRLPLGDDHAPPSDPASALLNIAIRMVTAGQGFPLALPPERVMLNTLRRTVEDDSSLVVHDYVRFLDDMRWEPHAPAEYLPPPTDLLDAFSKEVLQGTVRRNWDRERVDLRFDHGDGAGMPLHAVASVVKSLAGLSLYLERHAFAGDTLVIDEPEMNAHPSAQLAIVECLAALVKRGIRIVVTTHSPFVLDHLVTLVEASMLEGEKRSAVVQKLRLRRDDALLSPEHLAVFRFGLDGMVTPIFDREHRSIDASTFTDVGDHETNLFSDILSAERNDGD